MSQNSIFKLENLVQTQIFERFLQSLKKYYFAWVWWFGAKFQKFCFDAQSFPKAAEEKFEYFSWND